MIVFIPIKHNSQRVSKKNFRIFNGEPLYKHTLLKYTADEVYVDTDSEQVYKEINSDSRLSNVNVFMRNKDLIGDEVSVCDLIENFIRKFNINKPIAQIHVTSPFLLDTTVKTCYNMMKDYDSIVSCNIHQVRFWRKEEYGFCPVNHNPAKLEQTQELPKYYEENSAFYIFKPEVLIKTGNRIGQKPFFYEIKDPENLDIDTEDDWNNCIRRINESRKS